jgi:hypothetical protein
MDINASLGLSGFGLHKRFLSEPLAVRERIARVGLLASKLAVKTVLVT